MKKIIGGIVLFLAIGQQIKAQNVSLDTLDIIKKTYDQLWELGEKNQKGTFRLVSYKPIYVTAGRVSNNPKKNLAAKIRHIPLLKQRILIILKLNSN